MRQVRVVATANFRPSLQSVAGSSLGAAKISSEKAGTLAAAVVMICCCSELRESNLAWFITSTVGNGHRLTLAVRYLATSSAFASGPGRGSISKPSTAPSRRARRRRAAGSPSGSAPSALIPSQHARRRRADLLALEGRRRGQRLLGAHRLAQATLVDGETLQTHRRSALEHALADRPVDDLLLEVVAGDQAERLQRLEAGDPCVPHTAEDTEAISTAPPLTSWSSGTSP